MAFVRLKQSRGGAASKDPVCLGRSCNNRYFPSSRRRHRPGDYSSAGGALISNGSVCLLLLLLVCVWEGETTRLEGALPPPNKEK